MLALPGSAYLYQGEELGLPEHTTLPDDARRDPTFARTGGAEVGRDGCRVPLPWTAAAPNLGFGPGAPPWLPQPEGYRALARDRQTVDPGSTLSLYTAALRLRRELSLGTGGLTWHSDPGSPVLDLARDQLRVTANLGPEPVPLPADAEVLLRSDDSPEPEVGVDTTVWWREPVR
jgi:alpha-glucosidase